MKTVHDSPAPPVKSGSMRCQNCGNFLISNVGCCALPFCGLAGKNSEASGASGADDGQRVHTPKPIGQSNLDSTKTGIVRKGCKVRFDGGLTAYVIKVRMGQCWAKGAVSGLSYFVPCSEVRVLS